ncbi:unnamed protein product, partial [Polarella glacialis]
MLAKSVALTVTTLLAKSEDSVLGLKDAFSASWLLSMQFSTENLTALLEAGYGQPPYNTNNATRAAFWEGASEAFDGSEPYWFACRAEAGAAAFWDVLRRDIHAPLSEDGRRFLEALLLDAQLAECIYGRSVVILRAFAEGMLMTSFGAARTAELLQELQDINRKSFETLVLSGWAPALMASLDEARERCEGLLDHNSNSNNNNNNTNALLDELDHDEEGALRRPCKDIEMCCLDLEGTMKTSRFKALTQHRKTRRESRFSKRRGDEIAITSHNNNTTNNNNNSNNTTNNNNNSNSNNNNNSSNSNNNNNKQPGEERLTDAVYGLRPCAVGSVFFPQWSLKDHENSAQSQRPGWLAHVTAASIRWSKDKAPCTDPEHDDFLALELLVFVQGETVSFYGPQQDAQVPPQDQGRAGGKYADSHCHHDSLTLMLERLTCVWPSGAEREAVQGPVSHWGTIVQCAVPAGADEDALAELYDGFSEEDSTAHDSCSQEAAGTGGGGGRSVAVRLQSGKAGTQSPLLQLCARRPEPRRRLVSCSQPLFNAAGMEAREPFLLQDWVNFHVALGIDHFHIYDLDGSFSKMVRPLQASGRVTYTPHFASKFSAELHQASTELNPYCLTPQAQDHCLFTWRGRADWVVFLTSPDVFLWSSVLAARPAWDLTALLDQPVERESHSDGSVEEVSLQAEWELYAGAFIRQVHFGGPPEPDTESVLERFMWRERDVAFPVGSYEFPLVQPWNGGLMNVINFTGRGLGHKMFRFHVDTLRADHFVDIFRPRCQACNIRDGAKLSLMDAILTQRLPQNGVPRSAAA